MSNEIEKKESTEGWVYTKGINWWVDKMIFPENFKKEEPITEDIPHEVIEPKKLGNDK